MRCRCAFGLSVCFADVFTSCFGRLMGFSGALVLLFLGSPEGLTVWCFFLIVSRNGTKAGGPSPELLATLLLSITTNFEGYLYNF